MVENPTDVTSFITGNIQLQQNGIDLRVINIEEVMGSAIIYRDTSDLTGVNYQQVYWDDSGRVWILKPGFYRLTFDAHIAIPNNLSGLIIHRSTLLRSGCTITSAWYDSGFRGTLGAFMTAHNRITIEHDARIAQILLFESNARCLYEGKYGDSIEVVK